MKALNTHLTCPKCGIALLVRVTSWDNGRMTEVVMIHQRVDHCEYSGNKFKPPAVELEEI